MVIRRQLYHLQNVLKTARKLLKIQTHIILQNLLKFIKIYQLCRVQNIARFVLKRSTKTEKNFPWKRHVCQLSNGFSFIWREKNPLLIMAHAIFQSINLVSMDQILTSILEFLKVALLVISVIVIMKHFVYLKKAKEVCIGGLMLVKLTSNDRWI